MQRGLSADIVVVGSGVAGALIAHVLARAGAMLEAGPRIERREIVENFRNSPAGLRCRLCLSG
jgi:choline dehydrogenase-like flavoprotein